MKKCFCLGLIFIMLLTLLASCRSETVETAEINYDELLKKYERKTETYIDELYQEYGQVKRLITMDIFGQSEKEGKTEYYTKVYDTCYTLFKGKVYDGGGSGYADFCIVTVENGEITDVWYPKDGGLYWDSIKKKVGFIDYLKFKSYKDTKDIRHQNIMKAQEHFDARFAENNVLDIQYDETTKQVKYKIWQVDSTDIKIVEDGVLSE